MGSSIGKNSSNLLDTLPLQGTVHLVMLGLDSAGKTTALYRLKFDQYLNTVPTIGFNCEKVQGAIGKSKGIQFLVWDVGGQEKLRPLWRSYTRCTDGILFVVDSVDVERMEEAKMELMKTAKCPDNQGVPVLILANKQDLPGARDSKDLERLLGLHELSSSVNVLKHSISVPDGNRTKGNENKMDLIVKQNSNESNFSQHLLPIARSMQLENYPEPTENYCESSNKTKSKTNNLDDDKELILYKRWYIQPTCAITGDGLQEGLEILYNMILKRKKIGKIIKKKR